MLTNLTIKQYAIIDELELEFSNGLTVLTGETGAGKSILLGALGLVLGDRADTSGIKQSCSHAEITAGFDLQKIPAAVNWLKHHDLDADDECILRRRVARDGRSRAFVNGTPVNVQTLRELGERLIDIHGQHEHQSLMKNTTQRQLLDDYADHPSLLAAVSESFEAMKQTEQSLKQLEQDSSDRSNRVDLLRFQTQELELLALAENEYAELNEKHARLANAEKITRIVHQAINELYSDEETNVLSLVSHHLTSLTEIAEIDDALGPAIDMLQEANVQLEECVAHLRHYFDELELDPTELTIIDQRIQSILDLSRKHRVEPDQLADVLLQLSTELDDVSHAGERLDQLRAQYQAQQQQYQSAAGELSISRRQAADQLNSKISDAMQTLGMKGGTFLIKLSSDPASASVHGIDKAEFTVSANAGQSCQPLARVASGGELARISLAIQMITATQCRIPTMIFDEVDSGVGGGVAEIVGRQLRLLGNSNQVVCITHLAQVASQAHQHLRVHKRSDREQTQTNVYPLDQRERIEEIARMLSGMEITEQSLAHAKEMISRAQTH
ncbi:MAG: DNA repair protein RecN [Gammaproteobacteria bacterium]|nr:DNA repair protein RecN [Gammaproteobacteria bacterium]